MLYTLTCLCSGCIELLAKIVLSTKYNFRFKQIFTQKFELKEIEYDFSIKESMNNSYSKPKTIIEKHILEYSFRIEHLIREIGQIYEAYSSTGDHYDYCSQLSMAGAQLLVDGYPIELMDGDAAHVPIIGNDHKVYVCCSGHTLNDDCLVMTILICLPLPLFSSPLYYITSHSLTIRLNTYSHLGP